MDWYPDKYLFYIDGKQVWDSNKKLPGVCNQPGYIKVTAEISTESWAINQWWSNDPAKATYPDSFKVDYGRVYQFDTSNPTGVNTIEQDKNIEIYPNPVDESINVILPEELSANEKPGLQIINSNGQVIKLIEQVCNAIELSVNDLTSGLYFLTVQLKDASYTQKFMKN